MCFVRNGEGGARGSRSFLALLALLVAASVLYAQTELAVPELRRADKVYSEGNFDEAILILKDYLEKPDLAQSEQEAALRLLGLSYLGKTYRDEAREAVANLLRLVPDYQPDLENDPPTYVRLVEETREIIAKEEKGPGEGGSRKWMYAAGGAVIAGIAIGIASGGGGGGEENPTTLDPISRPPGLPE
ncbi:MAG: hypothetical protein JW958_14635 [Candidatus Eisenbacteria bacterium]|nr:hypothetical protein [Candidatus Eisenbacteria bacterium]